MKNATKVSSKVSNLILGIGLILTGVGLFLNLAEYVEASKAMRQYSCEYTYSQGVNNTTQFIEALALAPENQAVSPILFELTEILKNQFPQWTAVQCQEVDLTYVELEYYRIKKSMEGFQKE